MWTGHWLSACRMIGRRNNTILEDCLAISPGVKIRIVWGGGAFNRIGTPYLWSNPDRVGKQCG